MAINFNNLGMGFLPTDPRAKKLPTGGSISASQPKDTSVIITGNPADMGIGFGSSKAIGRTLLAPPTGPKLAPEPMTEAERTSLKESRGVATTHENMGSLAQSPGVAAAAEARAQKVIDTREADAYKRNILDPMYAEAGKFRSQAAAAKDMLKGARGQGGEMTSNTGKVTNLTGGRANTTLLQNRQQNQQRRAQKSGLFGNTPRNRVSEANSRIGPGAGKGSTFLSDWQEMESRGDPAALDAQRSHGMAPYIQAMDWAEMANAQSATGKASPGEMAQAAASALVRGNPNK